MFSPKMSYGALVVILAGMGFLELGALFLSILFAYFALDQLQVLRRRWLTLSVFLLLVALICSGLGFVVDQAIHKLPQVALTAIPSMTQFAKEKNIELPFSDWDTLKTFAQETVQDQLPYIGKFTRTAAKNCVLILAGIIIAASLFLSSTAGLWKENPASFYAVFWRELSARFASFYQAFKVVMRAQLIIAAINTGLTAIFLVAVSMPSAFVLIVATFFCGLLPIIGNLISNSIIVGIGFTVSPQLGIEALVFLIILHKLEYFLNSKIIGQAIKNPLWLMLIALVVGERLLGITGIILAPVFLVFFRTEASREKNADGEPT